MDAKTNALAIKLANEAVVAADWEAKFVELNQQYSELDQKRVTLESQNQDLQGQVDKLTFANKKMGQLNEQLQQKLDDADEAGYVEEEQEELAED